LTETSHQIFNLTSGRLQLRHITFRLPAAWGAAPTCAPPTTARTNSWAATDLRLSPGPNLLGLLGQPWSIQPEGCGLRGRGHIEAGLEFFAAAGGHNQSTEARAAALAREWVKLQFGVFEEAGFPEDPLYPATLTEGRVNITNAGCAHTVQVQIYISLSLKLLKYLSF